MERRYLKWEQHEARSPRKRSRSDVGAFTSSVAVLSGISTDEYNDVGDVSHCHPLRIGRGLKDGSFVNSTWDKKAIFREDEETCHLMMENLLDMLKPENTIPKSLQKQFAKLSMKQEYPSVTKTPPSTPCNAWEIPPCQGQQASSSYLSVALTVTSHSPQRLLC